MQQYGDIRRISGAMLEPVDLIVGGSPCQDISQAGLREGLSGKRSSLFFEMIRVIKQMRSETNGIYPRYALFENVPGLLSSNDGRDFSTVLGEFIRITEPNAPDVPCPEEGWPKSGIILLSNGAISWRITDSQFWGVAQRRRRIALVRSFGNQSAWEILFESRFSSGHPEKSEEKRERTAGTFTDSIGVSGANNENLLVRERERENVLMIEMTSTKNTIVDDGISPTITARMGTGGNQVNAVMTMQGFGDYVETDVASSCKQRDYKDATDLVCRIQTDQSIQHNAMQDECQYVRRLTPLEVERLQGFPDGWCAIPGASDSARYRALGNSIALPFWEYLAHRFVQIGNVQTIGSLFDGIGGFPLVFKRAGAETLWTSEIEPFCQRVVEYHIKNGDL